MDYPGRLIAAFVAVVLIALFPLQYIAQSNIENIDYLVDDYTQSLSDTIREKGYIDQQMYDEYVGLLDSTGERYDIDIEDIHPVTGDEVEEHAQAEDNVSNMSFNNSENPKVSMLKTSYTSNLPAISTGMKKSSLNNLNSINHMFEDNYGKIFSFAIHTHTDDCYAGHRHNSSCYGDSYFGNNTSIEMYSTLNTDSIGSNGIRESIDIYHDISYGSDCMLGWITYYQSIYDDQVLSGTVSATTSYMQFGQYYLKTDGTKSYHMKAVQKILEVYSYPGEGWIKISDTCYRKINPEFNQWITYFGNNEKYGSNSHYFVDMNSLHAMGWNDSYSCPDCLKNGSLSKSIMYNLICGQTQDETPVCDQVVTSITATNPNQTVNQGENIISTATVIMLNGTNKTVNCTVSGYDSSKLGSQTATLTYSGLIGNAKTTGTISCSVNVTVKNPKTLTSISVTPAEQTIKRNGSPSFTVKAYYSDGSSSIQASSQYTMSSFDSDKAGLYTADFSYTENGITKTASATIYVDDLAYISITPDIQSVERYTTKENLPFTVTASYLYSNSKVITSGYEITGYSPSILGEQAITVSYTENGTTKTTQVKVNVTVLHKTCPRCHNIYELTIDDIDPGCPFCKQLVTGITVTPDSVEVTQGDSLPIEVMATYNDESTSFVSGWTSNYDTSKIGLQTVTVKYGGYASEISVWVIEPMITCPICHNTYPSSEGRCPVCSETIISISAVPGVLTVKQNGDINLTVTACFADGVSETVTDWSIDKETAEPGSYTATVSYQGASTTITLIVISETAVTCPICGRSYEPTENPRGCPVCSVFLVGIEAYLTSGTNLVQYGSVPGIDVVLIYQDSHREITSDGYTLENYDAYKLGDQTVTVRYEEFSATLDIKIVNTVSSVTCPYGHVYYLNEDGTDPGCPYCAMAQSLETVYYFDITYADEILDKVCTDGIYHFKSGNFISINVRKDDVSLLSKIQNMFPYKTVMLGRKEKFTYGGEVF